MKASEWIDRAKLARGWETDYRAGKELGFSKNTISNFRTGRAATMDEDSALKVAQALQLDPALVLADQAMERARTEPARSAWAAVLQRLGGVAAGLLVASGLSSAPAPAQAASSPTTAPLCVLRKVPAPARRRRGAVAAMAAWLSTPHGGMMPAGA